MEYQIRTPKNEIEWEAYYTLRYEVLRRPLGKEKGSELNEGDATALHFAMFIKDEIIGVARLDQVNNVTYQARFVAINPNFQGNNLGRILMEHLEQKVIKLGANKMILHARDYALKFYEKLNYKTIGPSYKLFDVLQHYLMEKEL